MESFASLWWVWLIGMVVCGFMTIVNQVKKARSMFTGTPKMLGDAMKAMDNSKDNLVEGTTKAAEGFFGNAFKGVLVIMITGALTSLFFIMLLIAAAYNIFH